MKKMLSIAIALVLCMALLASPAMAWTYSAPGELPIVTDGPAELTVYGAAHGNVIDYTTNYATLWFEEKTGVKVNWQLVSSTDVGEKTSLLLATNNKADMPDVFFNASLSRAVAEAYGSQGILMDLTDLIADYGTNMQALAAHNPTFANDMVAYDGGIYFLSRYYETVHTRATQKIWMNMKWLENVGKEVPTTIDEYYDVLVAFKEQDANGNGDATDEIPMIHHTGYAAHPGNGIMQSFVYWAPNGEQLYVEDGVVKASYAQEGYKEGLKFYKKLYDEGLVDNELFSMTLDQAKALAADPNGNRVGVTFGGTQSISDMAGTDIMDFEVIDPLTGPTGLKQTARENVPPTPFAAISGYCEDAQLAYRWLDAQLYDSSADIANGDYEWVNFWYGEENVGWAKSEEGKVGFTGEQAAYKWLFNWGENQNTHWYETFLINMPEGWKPLIESEMGDGYNQEKILYWATKDHMEPYMANMTLSTPSLEEDAAVEVAELSTALNTYWHSMMAKFVTGEADIDAEWDSYLAELDKIGLARYTEIYAEALAR